MTAKHHQTNANGTITFGKISPAQYNQKFGMSAEQQIKNHVHATYFGWESPINGGPGVWVHDHVTDEVVDKLWKLPYGVYQQTINRNLEIVGAVYYEHWDMHPHAKRAMVPYSGVDGRDGERKVRAEKL